jgi:hypothetical protein
MSGTGGMMLDGDQNSFEAAQRQMNTIGIAPPMPMRGEKYGGPFLGMPGGPNGQPQIRDMRYRPKESGGNPIDQPIFGFPGEISDPYPFPDIDNFDPMPNPVDLGGKGGFPPPSVGIDPTPIQGGGNGGGANGPGLDHLKDYGPVVEQMKQYVQSMSGLIDQINSKF